MCHYWSRLDEAKLHDLTFFTIWHLGFWVQDFYEKVPEVGEWPLPPIPKHGINQHDGDDFDEDEDDEDCVEISHAELEDQAAQERHSFMSGSSANEEDEEVRR